MLAAEDKRARGAAWRIWDLHVHTPASLVQHFGHDSEATWERFISELEELPADMSVIGINDYWFLDGYRKVREAKQNGRLKNLDAIFPVIEMRLDQFGGTDGKLSRVNMHVVFDPELSPEVIEAQFVSALQPKAKLSPGNEGTRWQGTITRESLADLGNRIKSSVPATEIARYGSDLMEGFNNLNVSLADVQGILEGPYFKGRTLIGIGKTEWRDVKWNQQSIAAKKTVINSADFIFTAFPDTSKWSSDVKLLRESGVTHQLLDCSDAHYFADSDQHMRLGACQTWMNSAPTFAGLAYALKEFERRVFVGLEPPALARIRKNPERFIDRVRVLSDDAEHDLFDHDLPLNTGFIAVVGNKGQGKSAFLDCIALAGNSARDNEFAFLSPTRFLRPTSRKLAKHYFSEVTWVTGAKRNVALDQKHDKAVPVSVEYLPQMFVERVCNLDPDTDDGGDFEEELRTVLFTHINEEARSGERTFSGLLAQKTRTSDDDLVRLREELAASIRAFQSLSSFRVENKLSEVQARFDLRNQDVRSAETAVSEAEATLRAIDSGKSDDGDSELEALRNRSEEIEKQRSEKLFQLSENEKAQATTSKQVAALEAIMHKLQGIESDVAKLSSEAEFLLNDEVQHVTPSQTRDAFAFLVIDVERRDAWLGQMSGELQALKSLNENLQSQILELEADRHEIEQALAVVDSERERARQRVIQTQERVSTLKGDGNDLTSLVGLQGLLEKINSIPDKIKAARADLLERAKAIYLALEAQLSTVKSLYQPASDFIAGSEVVRNAGLEFNAELRILPNWRKIAESLDGRRNGDFSEWLLDLPQRVEDTSWRQLAPELEEALNRLERERAEPEGELRDPASALRASTTLGEFLTALLGLSWIEVRFGLTGDGLPLSQLSPGQRGLVLALFYLVVDRRTTPLLLDQPEENLDNETIASKLVPAIHEASGRRQTIVVTHNANLAIVGDADQIIHCQMDRNRFRASSGSITEINVARFALNVLEGTKPAFDNRREKYEAVPSLECS